MSRHKRYVYNDISVQEWIKILNDSNVINEEMKNIIKVLYTKENKKLNAKAIAEILSYSHYAQLNRIVGRCGRVIKENYSVPHNEVLNLHNNWFIVFDGEEIRVDRKLYFNWVLKENMITALDQSDFFSYKKELLRLGFCQ